MPGLGMCPDPLWPRENLRVVRGDLRCEGPAHGLVHRCPGIPNPSWELFTAWLRYTQHPAQCWSLQVLTIGLLEQNAASFSHLFINP